MTLKTETLFMMEDKILGQIGLYTMWTMFFVSNLAVLAEDDTKGPSRNFNILLYSSTFERYCTTIEHYEQRFI